MKKKTTTTATESMHFKATRMNQLRNRLHRDLWSIIHKMAEETIQFLDDEYNTTPGAR